MFALMMFIVGVVSIINRSCILFKKYLWRNCVFFRGM